LRGRWNPIAAVWEAFAGLTPGLEAGDLPRVFVSLGRRRGSGQGGAEHSGEEEEDFLEDKPPLAG